ncbi:hypothetical protein BZA05DRAFT_422515 [Tricharina praecox]|uniref:uncharacterized protein n=1 Tax=Tricharina praecox TaxID=43433 RepID=UPI002220A3B1|nr:uncharacterized protein BZA05DRAFT_423016 [Tricharina praecox]XP_051335137.1 uncharacterized protein BZA05DRAFT_422515 [Tricharina praecox]KAI5840899.1 hypothetical protein BZA05DRAFT_423016 [Tricharina praecox]KAI5842365.1 hypothetical protein BZA05DRAFT_422515 [Tricharina praecox]
MLSFDRPYLKGVEVTIWGCFIVWARWINPPETIPGMPTSPGLAAPESGCFATLVADPAPTCRVSAAYSFTVGSALFSIEAFVQILGSNPKLTTPTTTTTTTTATTTNNGHAAVFFRRAENMLGVFPGKAREINVVVVVVAAAAAPKAIKYWMVLTPAGGRRIMHVASSAEVPEDTISVKIVVPASHRFLDWPAVARLKGKGEGKGEEQEQE